MVYFRQLLKKYLLAGLLVLFPIVITFMVIQWLVKTMDNLFFRLLPVKLTPETIFGFHIPGLGLLISFSLILIVGFLSANFLGKWFLHRFDKLANKLPLVGAIYSMFKQLATTSFGQHGNNFRRVVLIEYPRKEIWSIGFVTGTATGEVQDKTLKKVLNIFVPTTPNPTSGFYIMVPEENTISLKMDVDDAFKLIISGGIYTPNQSTDSITEPTDVP